MRRSSNDTPVRRGIASVKPNLNRTVTKSADENQKTAKKDTTKIKSLRQSPRNEPSQKPKASALSFRDADSGLPPASTDSTLSRAHLQAQLEFPLKNFKRNSRRELYAS